jgi:N-acetylglucosamine-6-sulfatase
MRRLRLVLLSILIATLSIYPARRDLPVNLDAKSASAETRSRPDIVLILTDDQTVEELSEMPVVQSELVGKGVTFGNGFVVNPLCCPSRATILTGKYSHGTDIYQNVPPHGGFGTFTREGEDASTIATWLHAVGYHTGLVGKYLNGYDNRTTYIPPGWDTWDAELLGDDEYGGYYNYTMNINGTLMTYGSGEEDYGTDVLAKYATAFIADTPIDKPLFLYFAPHAPHAPATPPLRYRDALPDLPKYRPPNYNEADVSDKPAWVQQLPPLGAADIDRLDRFRQGQFQALLAVDDAVRHILSMLAARNRLSTTLIVFASDNGLEQGSHRWAHKQVPWEEADRIPIVVRYDPLTRGVARRDLHLVLNLDFAPTFANAAQTDAPNVEGTSFLPLLTSDDVNWRWSFLIEHWGGDDGVPAYCGVRIARYKYVEYATGEEELYDLLVDPYELDNLAHNLSKHSWYLELKQHLHERMVKLCSPPPPDFVP